jgi:tripartite-type tricarboxylate transporter receptor subunit TctC
MLVATSPFLFMAEANSKYKTMNELIAAAKANPGKVSYGTAGNGTFTHLVMELLQVTGNFKMEQVPYKGASPAMTDLLGGHIPMAALSIGSGMPGIQGGKLRGLAVTSLKRSPALPDVPTLDESGFKNFEATGWLGILVPNGTPPDVVTRLNAELAKTMQNPELRATLLKQGIETRTGTAQEFGTLMASDTAKWHKIIKDAGIQTD